MIVDETRGQSVRETPAIRLHRPDPAYGTCYDRPMERLTELLEWLPPIVFTWTLVVVVWIVAFVVAAMILASRLSARNKAAIMLLSFGGAFGLVWAGLVDLGIVRAEFVVPEPDPMLLGLWGLGATVLLPVLFLLLGGPAKAKYHASWAPVVYVSKGISLAASVVAILGFYIQHMR